MKKAHLGLFALVSIVGLGSAFTQGPKHFTGTTYYGITNNANGMRWTTHRPDQSLFFCDAASAYCTIVTNGTPPTAGNPALPSGATAIKAGLYRPRP